VEKDPDYFNFMGILFLLSKTMPRMVINIMNLHEDLNTKITSK
jgi:hypothetical protein